jgi:hypothetical protein
MESWGVVEVAVDGACVCVHVCINMTRAQWTSERKRDGIYINLLPPSFENILRVTAAIWLGKEACLRFFFSRVQVRKILEAEPRPMKRTTHRVLLR